MTDKTCKCCKQTKPLDDFHKKGPERLQPDCKTCVSERFVAYYKTPEGKARIDAKNKAWRAANRTKWNQMQAEYSRKNYAARKAAKLALLPQPNTVSPPVS